ncbi:unnamed protein product [Cyprideis torosa]|uniref:Uncharacterized protein n=1 Tax=Cyprideis torosa TaxID=163714 RepID=A0A7R8W713_9CRUS|nr:unnamed protein product [Cyprideis torosa]CAG0887084.1 unnamed protein product [Cyprideis torosa]
MMGLAEHPPHNMLWCDTAVPQPCDPNAMGTEAPTYQDLDISSHPPICAGCKEKIIERFYLQAVDRPWHAQCLKCSVCGILLEGSLTCYTRHGAIFCRDDYQRLPGRRSCGTCGLPISAQELVMRARDIVFHVYCFNCYVCGFKLHKGDHFGLKEGRIYCRAHYEVMSLSSPPLMHLPTPMPGGPPSPNTLGPPPGPLPPNGDPNLLPQTSPPQMNYLSSTAPQPQGMAPTGPSRGRPRKKRKLEDLNLSDTSMDAMCNNLDGNPRSGSPFGHQQRPKRVRTSFKHHQLRTMKSYFSVNHNPDAKDLKVLSQKTGLSKRVLQVWFQNARAKWRRTVTSGRPGSADSSASAKLDLDTLVDPASTGPETSISAGELSS